jgi:hypothetical protein
MPTGTPPAGEVPALALLITHPGALAVHPGPGALNAAPQAMGDR